jgi:hypothetical protein
MSTHINDLHSGAVVAAGVHPTTISTNSTGLTVDLGAANGDGPCFAIQHVGAIDEEGTLDGRIEQSADASSWSAISGATFTQVSAPNDIQVIRFTRTMRYVRWAGTVVGSGVVFNIAVSIGSQKKTY